MSALHPIITYSDSFSDIWHKHPLHIIIEVLVGDNMHILVSVLILAKYLANIEQF